MHSGLVAMNTAPQEVDDSDWSMFRERLTLSESRAFFNSPDVENKLFEESWANTLRIGDHSKNREYFGPQGFEKEILGGGASTAFSAACGLLIRVFFLQHEPSYAPTLRSFEPCSITTRPSDYVMSSRCNAMG